MQLNIKTTLSPVKMKTNPFPTGGGAVISRNISPPTAPPGARQVTGVSVSGAAAKSPARKTATAYTLAAGGLGAGRALFSRAECRWRSAPAALVSRSAL